jgi:gamma-carbonic anhydrase
MPLILPVKGIYPQFGKNNFIADNATVVGDVQMGDDCSVWFQAVVRGDVNSIRIGNKVNIQDGAVLHCTYQKTKVEIADNVSIGHRALIHGCKIGSEVLIGMGAIVMDNVVIENNVLVAAGAVVLENSILKTNGIYAGVPARRVKELSPEMFQNEILRIANAYTLYASWFTNPENS